LKGYLSGKRLFLARDIMAFIFIPTMTFKSFYALDTTISFFNVSEVVAIVMFVFSDSCC